MDAHLKFFLGTYAQPIFSTDLIRTEANPDPKLSLGLAAFGDTLQGSYEFREMYSNKKKAETLTEAGWSLPIHHVLVIEEVEFDVSPSDSENDHFSPHQSEPSHTSHTKYRTAAITTAESERCWIVFEALEAWLEHQKVRQLTTLQEVIEEATIATSTDPLQKDKIKSKITRVWVVEPSRHSFEDAIITKLQLVSDKNLSRMLSNLDSAEDLSIDREFALAPYKLYRGAPRDLRSSIIAGLQMHLNKMEKNPDFVFFMWLLGYDNQDPLTTTQPPGHFPLISLGTTKTALKRLSYLQNYSSMIVLQSTQFASDAVAERVKVGGNSLLLKDPEWKKVLNGLSRRLTRCIEEADSHSGSRLLLTT